MQRNQNMAGKITKLTSEELHDIIESANKRVLDEMETCSITAAQANNLYTRDRSGCFKKYIGETFKFFSINPMGLIIHVLFTFNGTIKLKPNKTILTGDVILSENRINGGNIILDFAKGTVKYRDRVSRCTYDLEIDNRYKPLWDCFANELKQDFLL